MAVVFALLVVLLIQCELWYRVSSGLLTSESPTRAELVYAASNATISHFPSFDANRDPATCYPGPMLFCRNRNSTPQPTQYNSGDDVFLYWVPVVGRQLLGVPYPFLLISLLHLFETTFGFGVFLVLAATGRYALVGALLLAASFYVLLGHPTSLIETSYYDSLSVCVLTLALVCSIFVLTFWNRFDRVSRWVATAAIVPLSVLVAVAVMCRSSAMVSYLAGVVVFTVLLLLKYSHPAGIRHISRGIILLTVSVILTLFSMRALEHLMVTNPEYNFGSQHVVWHTVWCSLGFDPNNPYGFKWSDTEAQLYAQSVDPDVVAYSVEYEQILRSRVLDVLRSDPSYLIRWQAHQLGEANYWQDTPSLLLAGLVVVGLTFLGRGVYAESFGPVAVAVFAAATLVAFVPALLSATNIPAYSYPVEVGKLAVFGYVCLLLWRAGFSLVWCRLQTILTWRTH